MVCLCKEKLRWPHWPSQLQGGLEGYPLPTWEEASPLLEGTSGPEEALNVVTIQGAVTPPGMLGEVDAGGQDWGFAHSSQGGLCG